MTLVPVPRWSGAEADEATAVPLQPGYGPSAGPLTPLRVREASPNHHRSFPPFTSSSSPSCHLSPQVLRAFQPNEREMTQFIQIRDTFKLLLDLYRGDKRRLIDQGRSKSQCHSRGSQTVLALRRVSERVGHAKTISESPAASIYCPGETHSFPLASPGRPEWSQCDLPTTPPPPPPPSHPPSSSSPPSTPPICCQPTSRPPRLSCQKLLDSNVPASLGQTGSVQLHRGVSDCGGEKSCRAGFRGVGLVAAKLLAAVTNWVLSLLAGSSSSGGPGPFSIMDAHSAVPTHNF
ncbi:unnamed protein product [Pleuronectes platessa]|uniref:Uncharacterized protein n=1 Tax=Pleuronectes platessa TaxID=8262 RepID=A0A9N7TJ42_PLEPL|nr:unnamed protein product [Pleuronectes platessa]